MTPLQENLRSLRADRGLSQSKLGKIVGVTRGAVSQWEQGETVPSMEHLIMLAKHFKLPLEQITGHNAPLASVGRALMSLDSQVADALRASFLVQIAAVKKPENN